MVDDQGLEGERMDGAPCPMVWGQELVLATDGRVPEFGGWVGRGLAQRRVNRGARLGCCKSHSVVGQITSRTMSCGQDVFE